jgi:hypothetical protein
MNVPFKPPRTPHSAEFEDLTAGQQQVLRNVSRICLRRVADAKKELTRALSSPSPLVATHFKIVGIEPADKRDLRKIIANYNRMAGVLLGHEKIRYDGEHTGPGFNLGVLIGIQPAAYVRGLGPVPQGAAGEVKLVKNRFFSLTTDRQVWTVLHELGHRFVGLRDLKYYGSGRAIQISRQNAMKNSDSYAAFAQRR